MRIWKIRSFLITLIYYLVSTEGGRSNITTEAAQASSFQNRWKLERCRWLITATMKQTDDEKFMKSENFFCNEWNIPSSTRVIICEIEISHRGLVVRALNSAGAFCLFLNSSHGHRKFAKLLVFHFPVILAASHDAICKVTCLVVRLV